MLIEGRFEKQLAEWQLKLTKEQELMFVKYHKLLLSWNKVMNLTGITEKKQVYDKHFLDSLSLVKVVDLKKEQRIIDVGSGAGFPGVPLKIIFPHLQVVLLDSLKKRVDFLEGLVGALGLEGVVCLQGRAEDVARKDEYRQGFDLAVSRAVGSLTVLSEYTLPFVKVGGCFVAYKSYDTEEEIESSVRGIGMLGGEIKICVDFSLPATDIKRRLLVIEKVQDTPNEYPRRPGKPLKKPLL